MSDHDKLIEQFISISGVDNERAKFFLESANWNIVTALENLYEEGDADPVASERDVATPTQKGPNMPKLSIPSDDSSSDEEGQAFYAGGSEHSGQQVLGPKKKKKDIISQLFKSAKDHGAEVLENVDARRAGTSSFAGMGYRLGVTTDDHEAIRDPSASMQARRPRDVTLGMWRAGFTVDGGPLRAYDDPANQEFITSIKRGEIPIELLREVKGGEVFINMEDHRHEEYVVPKQTLKAFTGAGQALGSPAPTVLGQELRPNASGGGATGNTMLRGSLNETQENESDAKEGLELDETQPTTNIQVRLPDGSRLVLRMNHTHTIGDLRSYIHRARPNTTQSPFAIMTVFPHAELQQDSLTLSEAKILNSALVVKAK